MEATLGPVSWSVREDGLGWIRMDDGRANAINPDLLAGLEAALAGVASAPAVVLEGRPDRFCAGLDLRVLPALPTDELRAVLKRFAGVCRLLAEHPRPLVAAATGHAIAGGAVFLLCCDHRVGARGDYRFGLNEVAIGLGMPSFVIQLARWQLPRRTLRASVLHGLLYGPEEALEAGFLDEVHDPAEVSQAAAAAAARLATLPDPAYRDTKARLHGELDVSGFLDEAGAFFTEHARRYAERFR